MIPLSFSSSSILMLFISTFIICLGPSSLSYAFAPSIATRGVPSNKDRTKNNIVVVFINDHHSSSAISTIGKTKITTSSSARWAAPPQRRVARRDLKKRPRRKRSSRTNPPVNEIQSSDSNEIVEIRTIVRPRAIEAGEDYWIDENDLRRAMRREEVERARIKNALRDYGGVEIGSGSSGSGALNGDVNRDVDSGNNSDTVGSIINMSGRRSREKLLAETIAPYRQNWIGIMSMSVVMLVAIVTYFPELMEAPSIPFPDL